MPTKKKKEEKKKELLMFFFSRKTLNTTIYFLYCHAYKNIVSIGYIVIA